jgi:hypothetical protein
VVRRPFNHSTKHLWIASCSRWKLHLRPAHLPLIHGLALPALPAGKTVDDVFADFLGYIRKQLEAYITNQYGAGADIWAALYPTMYVILTTPNGWEGGQQQRMRNAAIRAGLVDKDGGRRVRFVTEAEVCPLLSFLFNKLISS